MAATINASTSPAGIVQTADGTGILALQTGNTTAVTIDASQRAAFVAGTAALPAITTTGDTNTGMWFPAADTIAFSEGGAEAVRIDSSGNVGIGTTSPTTQLSLSQGGNGNNLNVLSRTHLGGTYSSNSLVLGYSVKADTTANDRMIGTETNSGGGAPAAILMNSGVMQFHTATSVTSGSAFSSERMRIDSSGNLLVGTTSGVTSGGFLFTVGGVSWLETGHITGTTTGYGYSLFRYAGTIIGRIDQSGTTNVTYGTSSDYRLKENVAPMVGALGTVAQLKPSTFNWKTDGSDGQGFIAHELQAVVPDCVSGEKDGLEKDGTPRYQNVDTSFLVATLTAAIQEQQALITSLTARITALEGA